MRFQQTPEEPIFDHAIHGDFITVLLKTVIKLKRIKNTFCGRPLARRYVVREHGVHDADIKIVVVI